MKLVIGLGNSEPEYSWTRHNTGKEVVNLLYEELAEFPWKRNAKIGVLVSKGSLGTEKFLLAKPLGYMNEVGQKVKRLVDYYDVTFDNLLIVYDELDLAVGEYKLKFVKGSKSHNGILSIEKHIKSKSYWHLRIGIRGKNIAQSVQKTGRSPSKYVLAKFGHSDKEKILELYKESLSKDLAHFLSKKE